MNEGSYLPQSNTAWAAWGAVSCSSRPQSDLAASKTLAHAEQTLFLPSGQPLSRPALGRNPIRIPTDHSHRLD